MMADDHEPLVLIVDDTEANIDVLVEVLGDDCELSVATSGQDALDAVAEQAPDIILLDIMMPGMDGYEVCRRLKAQPNTAGIPVIFVSAMNEERDETEGFAVGAVDYITKPISPAIVQARVRTHLALADQQRTCQRQVMQQIEDIKRGQKDAVFMLGRAGDYNDEDTGVHVWRMAAYAEVLARAASWSVGDQEMLHLAAPMHDIGKIGMPDAILKKAGKLTSEEWAMMREHPLIGHKILSISDAPLFRMAADIALSHHERWEGGGYPNGISGEDIPESARIVAITDVFDALTMKRSYKEAWSFDDAFGYIADNKGHFEPRLAELFLSRRAEITEIKDYWLSKENSYELVISR